MHPVTKSVKALVLVQTRAFDKPVYDGVCVGPGVTVSLV